MKRSNGGKKNKTGIIHCFISFFHSVEAGFQLRVSTELLLFRLVLGHKTIRSSAQMLLPFGRGLHKVGGADEAFFQRTLFRTALLLSANRV